MDNNWTITQTKTLFSLCREAKESGRGLIAAFTDVAAQTGRSINSVRNYYYSQRKMFELVPSLAGDLGITLTEKDRERFTLFTQNEIDELLKEVLVGKANGVSVRKTILRLSDGNGKTALRLQNKYRSLILHHRDKVTQVMRVLSESGMPYYNPYLREKVLPGEENDNYKKLNEYISSLDETEVGEFLHLMKKFFA